MTASTVPAAAPTTAGPRRSAASAAVIVVVALAFSGAAVGALWARIAPSIHTITALSRSGDRVDAFLGREADNLFVAVAMMVGLLSAFAVVAAVAVWQWRAHRGPLQVLALCIGLLAAGGAASGMGAALAHWRYGTADHAGVEVTPENRVHYFTEAPPVFVGHGPLQIAVTLLLPVALGALTYSVMTVATHRDDLGAWPPRSPARQPVTAAGMEPVHPA